jgi:hypothetical protein
MTWLYNGEEVTEVPENAVGFVYIIKCSTNDRKYIGKKLFFFTKTKIKTVKLKNGTSKKKKIREKIDSDWRDYYGSSNELSSDIQSIGIENFHREILCFCYSKAECSYHEARLQFLHGVLESDDWYNGHIMCRIHKSHIKNKIKKSA